MTTALATIFVLGVLIFVHELGHFLVAKWSGIKVERFSLGFPPKMIGKTVGETEYCISWLPLGGYVKMAGENPDESEITGDPREFMSKSVGTRFLVIIAGPMMNFVAAFLIFIGVLWLHGRDVQDPNHVIIGPVIEDGPAHSVGITSGDEILTIAGEKITDFEQMASMIHRHPGDSLEIRWLHEGDLYAAMVKTRTDTVKTPTGADSVIGLIGVAQGFRTESVGLGSAIVGGVGQTYTLIKQTYIFLWKFFTLQISDDAVSGPVGIATIAGRAAREGFNVLMTFMAILSINLAVLNLLPVPVLDGGHVLFLAIEKIRGKALSIRTRAIAQQVGLVLLLALILKVTYNDIMRIIGG